MPLMLWYLYIQKANYQNIDRFIKKKKLTQI